MTRKEKTMAALGTVIGAGVLAIVFWPKDASAKDSKKSDDKDDGKVDHYSDLPEPPKLWPSNDNESAQESPEPALYFMEPGRYWISARTEYKIPHKKGMPFEYDILVYEDDKGWMPATYGPYEDWIWEKETKADYAIIQFQKEGIYRLFVPNSGEYEFIVA